MSALKRYRRGISLAQATGEAARSAASGLTFSALFLLRAIVIVTVIASVHLSFLLLWYGSLRGGGFLAGLVLISHHWLPGPTRCAFRIMGDFYFCVLLIVIYGPFVLAAVLLAVAVVLNNWGLAVVGVTIPIFWGAFLNSFTMYPSLTEPVIDLPKRESVEISGEEAAREAAYAALNDDYRRQTTSVKPRRT